MEKKAKHYFDITKRPLSWSAISSFEWNREQWFAKYVTGEKPVDTPELIFGKEVDERLQEDPTFLPEIVRYEELQFKMECKLGKYALIGIADTFRHPFYAGKVPVLRSMAGLRDYKTGRKPWDQKRADETGQLTMYCLLLWQLYKIRPEDVELYIDWMPTHIKDGKIAFIEPVQVHTFKTRRTMQQVLAFGQRINDTIKEMEEYAAKRPVLDTSDPDEW
jgi:hypothetical protein